MTMNEFESSPLGEALAKYDAATIAVWLKRVELAKSGCGDEQIIAESTLLNNRQREAQNEFMNLLFDLMDVSFARD